PAWSAETAAEEPDWPVTGADDDDPGWVATLAAEVAGSAGVTADHAEDDLPEPEPLRHDLPEPEPLRHDLPEPRPPGHDLPEPGPAASDGRGDVDPAADWERLAAGAQTAQPEDTGAPASPAAPWIAQTDADVANEWPGPPLRTAMRNGVLASDAAPGPATLDP